MKIKQLKIKEFLISIMLYSNLLPADEKTSIIAQDLQTILQNHPEITYQKSYAETFFSFKKFPLSINQEGHPSEGSFNETFIIKIPNGIIQSDYGWVFIEPNLLIYDLIWKTRLHNLWNFIPPAQNYTVSIPKRVATITQPAQNTYFHWMTESLCRLALLEMNDVSFDYLVAPQFAPFMVETLQLWGINSEQIIAPEKSTCCMQAQELIVPSLVSNTNFGCVWFSCYAQPHLLEYVKNKLLTAAQQQTPTSGFSKRVFVSRKDSAVRNIINEDEIFQQLEPHGFIRYELAKMSVVDQIMLFYNADIIVSAQGTGLTNSIFCQPHVQLIELFQGLNDCTFWYLSQMLNLKYTPIATTEFIEDYLVAWQSPTSMPLSVVDDILKTVKA